MIEFVICTVAAGIATLVVLVLRRRRDARVSAQVGSPFSVSAALGAPGWAVLFDDRRRRLAVVSDATRAVVSYDDVRGWRSGPVLDPFALDAHPRQMVQIQTDDPRWPLLEIPLGTADAAMGRHWLSRLNANIQHRPANAVE